MKFCGPLYVVKDIERSKQFYKAVFGLRITSDYGQYVTLTGGLTLQECASWCNFIHTTQDNISFGGNNAELYFEEPNIDAFIEKLKTIKPAVSLIHDVQEHAWGQRVIRFYDHDKHIIEVGESLDIVCKRFWSQGLTIDAISMRTGLSPRHVERLIA